MVRHASEGWHDGMCGEAAAETFRRHPISKLYWNFFAFADPQAWLGSSVVHGVFAFVEAVLFHDALYLGGSSIQSFLRLGLANDYIVDQEADFLLDLET